MLLKMALHNFTKFVNLWVHHFVRLQSLHNLYHSIFFFSKKQNCVFFLVLDVGACVCCCFFVTTKNMPPTLPAQFFLLDTQSKNKTQLYKLRIMGQASLHPIIRADDIILQILPKNIFFPGGGKPKQNQHIKINSHIYWYTYRYVYNNIYPCIYRYGTCIKKNLLQTSNAILRNLTSCTHKRNTDRVYTKNFTKLKYLPNIKLPKIFLATHTHRERGVPIFQKQVLVSPLLLLVFCFFLKNN